VLTAYLGRGGRIDFRCDEADLEGRDIADVGDKWDIGDGQAVIRAIDRRLGAADQLIIAVQRGSHVEGRLLGRAGNRQVARDLKGNRVANGDAARRQSGDTGRLKGDELVGSGFGLQDETGNRVIPARIVSRESAGVDADVTNLRLAGIAQVEEDVSGNLRGRPDNSLIRSVQHFSDVVRLRPGRTPGSVRL